MNIRKISCLNREEEDRRPCKQRGCKKDGALANDEKTYDGDTEQHGDAKNHAAKKSILAGLRFEGVPLPQGQPVQAGRSKLQCEGLRGVRINAEGKCIDAQSAKRQRFAAGAALDPIKAASLAVRPDEARSHETLVRAYDDEVMRHAVRVEQRKDDPAVKRAWPFRLEAHACLLAGAVWNFDRYLGLVGFNRLQHRNEINAWGLQCRVDDIACASLAACGHDRSKDRQTYSQETADRHVPSLPRYMPRALGTF